MINKMKHIRKIKHKGLRAEEKKIKTFFLRKQQQKAKKCQLPRDLPSRGRLFIFVKHCQMEICKNFGFGFRKSLILNKTFPACEFFFVQSFFQSLF